MIKLLLCDDDEIVLSGLYDWMLQHRKDMNLVGCAENGKIARDLISEHHPDIIITDICMPFATGLELIEFAKTVNPNLRSIIISGYDEFKYARKAVQLGALDFILKPINIENLDSMLTSAAQSCRKDNSSRKLLIKNTVNQILDSAGRDEAVRLCADGGLKHDDFYSIVVLENGKYISPSEENLDEHRYEAYKEFNSLAESVLNLGVTLLAKGKTQIVICLIGADRRALTDQSAEIEAFVRRHNLANPEHHTITMAKGSVGKGIENLQKSYEDAFLCLRYKYIVKDPVINFDSLSKDKLNTSGSLPSFENYERLINIGSYKEIDDGINGLSNELKKLGDESDFFAGLVVTSVFINLSKNLEDKGVKLISIFPDPYAELKKVIFKGKTAQILSAFRELLYDIQKHVEICNKGSHTRAVYKAVNYIKNNYADPNLNLSEVAQHVFMSPNYFSSVFKSETTQTFTDYLISFRIFKAQNLIEKTDFMFYEISASVGYPNAAYFSSLFKKRTGCLPSEYKIRMCKSSGEN